MTPTRQPESPHGAHKAHALDCKVLLETAGREMYDNNAFRVTGLVTTATGREITKHGDRLKMQEELGNGEPTVSAAFAREPAPTLDEIRAALQRLKSPERRMVDEFFWFWPISTVTDGADAALVAIQQGQTNEAVAIWREQEKDHSIVAQHNLAVAYHLAALDRENRTVGRGGTEEQRDKIGRFWLSANKRWLKIMEDDRLWDFVADRIRQLNEPNLTTGFARQLRQNLRVALCRVHAELGLAYLGSSQPGYAQSQLPLIKQLSGETGAGQSAAELVLKPLAIRLRQQMDLAERRATTNAADGAEAGKELLSQARRASAQFELLLGSEDPVRGELFDDIADAANRIQFTYWKATSDHETCLSILQSALPYATTPEIIGRIGKNITALKSNITGKKLEPAYALLRAIQTGKESPYQRLELFRTKAAPLLTFVATDLEATDPARDELWDSAATVLRDLSVAIWNDSNNMAAAEAAIKMAMLYVRADDTRKKLLADQDFLDTTKREQIAALAARKLAEEKANRLRLIVGGAAAVLVVVVIIAANSGPSPRSSYTPSRSSYTPSVSPAPAANRSQGGGDTYRIPSYASAELGRDRQAIELAKSDMASLQGQLDGLSRQIQQERSYLDETNQSAIDAFNRKVREHNAVLARAQSQQIVLDQMIDAYNAKLRSYSR